jgi:predicted AlkP superfamily pyrophosphatase or phosphodiesterase
MSAVTLISIDGFSAALAADASLRLPALRGLAARGVTAAGLRPAFPSVTWPCHTTLITGTAPARHGILGNEVLDRASGRVLCHEGDRTQGDLVLHAAEGWFFSRHATPEQAAGAPGYRGTHGHRTDDPRLHAGFVAAGPSIVAGARVGVLDQREVAPTAAAMLGLTMPTAERPPSPLLLRR